MGVGDTLYRYGFLAGYRRAATRSTPFLLRCTSNGISESVFLGLLVPTSPKPMPIEIILDGATKTVTKKELFDLAAQGVINPQTPVSFKGTLATAGQVQGIVFGQPKPVPVPPASPFLPLPVVSHKQTTMSNAHLQNTVQTPAPVEEVRSFRLSTAHPASCQMTLILMGIAVVVVLLILLLGRCGDCNATGKTRTPYRGSVIEHTCSACNGTRFWYFKKCDKCSPHGGCSSCGGTGLYHLKH